jgi:hypothetical protein
MFRGKGAGFEVVDKWITDSKMLMFYEFAVVFAFLLKWAFWLFNELKSCARTDYSISLWPRLEDVE